MSIREYISDLKENKISLSVQNDKLKVSASRELLTKETIDSISTRKQEILTFLRSGHDLISPIEQQAHYSLSHAQKRLWILDQVIEVKGLYNVDIVHEFQDVNKPALEATLNALVVRHEILRTTFHLVDGEPRQRVNTPRHFNFKLTYHSLRTAAQQEDIKYLVNEESMAAFDLTKAALRATLFEKKDGRYLLVLVLHHIISDAWSVKVLTKDFSQFYDHFTAGQPVPSVLKIQYKDYCHWQNQRLLNGRLDRSRDYWLDRFSGELPSLEIPLDNKRLAFKSYEGAAVSFNLSPVKLHQLMSLAADTKVSLYMVFVTIVKILLYRYSNLQDDIIIGSVMAGRSNMDLEDQVGFYSNVVALRTKMDGDDSFMQLLSKVKISILKAYEHQDFPFDLLVDQLNIQHRTSRNPLFDVMISYEESDTIENDFRIVDEEFATDDFGVNKFDLTFSIAKIGEQRLEIDINYNTGLFDKIRIIRMAEHLRNLVSAILNTPDCAVSRLSYLSDEEVRQIVSSFNATQVNYDLELSIKALIEQRALLTPEATAVVLKDHLISFSELNARSNQLAHLLMDRFSIRRGDYVGVMMDSCLDRIMALLAIVKVGAAYVPIDCDFPAERIKYILNDTKVKTVLTGEQAVTTPDWINECLHLAPVKTLHCERYSTENTAVITESTDIFSVLYTSGSTGKPKGVLVPQKGLINRMRWLWEKYEFGPDDVIYQKTPFVFDVSIGELFMPLCFGAKLLVAPSDTSQVVLENILLHQVTYVHFSPTLLNNFLNGIEGQEHKFKSVRYVFSSGEALLKETVHHFYRKFDVPLVNLYGPTEASIEASYYEAKPEDTIVPIGRPIANVHLYVVDKNRQLLPIGVPGEIAIGGVGVARGYLNQDEKTKEKFVLDPYNQSWGEHMYLTGDVGVWNEKGEVEFLGRQDNQVSINGGRIELGEIESSILEHPLVKEAVVVVDKDLYNNYHLIAYYVKHQQTQKEHPPHTVDRPQEQAGESQLAHLEKICSRKSYAPDYFIDQLIDQRAAQQGERTAIIVDQTVLTYQELKEQSDRLASVLCKKGVVRGDHIALLVERSTHMIVSMLAILKTGAAYVPLDPDYPQQRIEFILHDARLKLILSDRVNASKLATVTLPIALCEEADKIETGIPAPFIPVTPREQHDICYVCYTSGSSGVPKGVRIAHYSLVDYVKTFADYFVLSNVDKVIQQASVAFDTSVEEIFPILCSGGTVVIQPAGGRDIDGLIRNCNEHHITVLSTTPLVINELNARHKEIELWPRAIISGGDELRPGFVANILKHTKLYNTYGPTEATVCVSFALIEEGMSCNVIGIPIANHKIYLLNEELQPIAMQAIGEIFIEGDGVAQGYLNREVETEKHFLKNPFGKGSLYRTGDLGRWNKDGLLEFVGRKDRQVKVKGYRVEPSEVDACISLFSPGIVAFTTARTDADDNKRLISYYTSNNDVDQKKMRSFLAQHLPVFMVPDYFISMEELPSTTNGKIDVERLPMPLELSLDTFMAKELKNFLRRKLPNYMVPSFFRNISNIPTTVTGKVDRKSLEKQNSLYQESNNFVAPKTDTEKKLAGIWQRILNRNDIGLLHNFFEVGGNSLKATRIVSAVYQEFGRSISLKEIFNLPTIEELAKVVDQGAAKEGLLVHLTPDSTSSSIAFFVPPILGSSTIFKGLADGLKSDLSIYGIQYKGFDTDEPFDESISKMASGFCNEVRKVQKSRRILLLGYSMGVPIVFEMTKMLEAEGCEVDLILIDRSTTPDDAVITPLEVEQVLQNELGSWIMTLASSEKERVKKLVYHNLLLLSRYRLNGKVKARILAIEADHNQSEKIMLGWQSYSSGTLQHRSMTADHYEIMEEQNVVTLSNWIIAFMQPSTVISLHHQEIYP